MAMGASAATFCARCTKASTRDGIKIVAINDLGDANTNAHLTRFDTVHGRFRGDVHVDGDSMVVNGDRIRVVAQRDPSKLPWGELGVDFVLECTGLFTSKAKASAHITAGAKKVVISAPGGDDVDATIVYGVNHDVLKASHTVISNASCTTNCLAPLVKVLHEKVGILSGVMNTIHSYTNDQVLTDVYHSDLRRARSATMSMIPTKTGAAAAVGLVLPELKGKIDGFAIRVPTINVSLVDLSFIAARKTTVEEIHDAIKAAADGALQGHSGVQRRAAGVGGLQPRSGLVDLRRHADQGHRGHAGEGMCWYDNEWGFSNRMLDTTAGLVESRLSRAHRCEDQQNVELGSARQARADPRGSERADPGWSGDAAMRAFAPSLPTIQAALTREGAGAGDVAPRPARRGQVRRGVLARRRWPSAWRSCSACRWR